MKRVPPLSPQSSLIYLSRSADPFSLSVQSTMFPFSPLPLLPQELILQELDPIDIFCFSLLSRKSHLIAKRVKVTVENVHWVFEKQRACAWIIGGPHDDMCLSLESNPAELDIYEKSMKCTFHGVTVDIQLKQGLQEMHLNIIPRTRLNLTEAGYERVLDVLNVKKFSVTLEECPIPPYMLKTTTIFKKVEAWFKTERISEKDAVTLFNDISVENFTMGTSTKEPFLEQQPLKHRKMTLHSATWITKEVLMRMQCEVLHVSSVHKPNLTSEDLEEFFDAWKDGKYPKLKELYITTKENSSWNLNVAPVDGHGKQVFEDVGGNTGVLKVGPRCLDFEVTP